MSIDHIIKSPCWRLGDMLLLISFLLDVTPSFFLATILGESLATFLALALDLSLEAGRFLEEELWLLFTSFRTFFLFPCFSFT